MSGSVESLFTNSRRRQEFVDVIQHWYKYCKQLIQHRHSVFIFIDYFCSTRHLNNNNNNIYLFIPRKFNVRFQMRLTILIPFQFSNQIKSNQMLVFEERGKPEYPEKNLSEQSREPTNSAHIWRRVLESNPGHIGGRWALSPLHQPCSPNIENWSKSLCKSGEYCIRYTSID